MVHRLQSQQAASATSIGRLCLNVKDYDMNWDRIEGNWKQLHGNVRAQWGKLTDDHFHVLSGKRDCLAGKIQERYGISRDESRQQLAGLHKRMKDMNHIK